MRDGVEEIKKDSSYKQNNKLPNVVIEAVKSINRRDPLPLYQQLLQSLYDVLKKEELIPGSFFATELLLQKITGMSRSTIRKALEELTRRGLLVRITGKGTFVSLPNVQVSVTELKSLTQELIEKGMKPGTVFLGTEWISVPEDVKDELNSEETVLCVRRIRTGNGIPLLYSTAYIPGSFGITDETDFTGSIYEVLVGIGKSPASATHTIKATIISQEIAKTLGVSPRTAGLFIQRKTYDAEGNFILYEEGVGRGDLYNYTLRMQHYSHL